MLGLVVPGGIAPEVVPALQDDALPGLKLLDHVGPAPDGFFFVLVDAHFLEVVCGPDMDLVVTGAGVKGDEVWGGIFRLDEHVFGVEDRHLGDLLAEPRRRHVPLDLGRESSPLRFVIPLDILRCDWGAILPLSLGMKRGLKPLVGQLPFREEPGDDRVVLIPHEQEHVEVVRQKRGSEGLDWIEVIPSPPVYCYGQFADRGWGTTGSRLRGRAGCSGGDVSDCGQATATPAAWARNWRRVCPRWLCVMRSSLRDFIHASIDPFGGRRSAPSRFTTGFYDWTPVQRFGRRPLSSTLLDRSLKREMPRRRMAWGRCLSIWEGLMCVSAVGASPGSGIAPEGKS